MRFVNASEDIILNVSLSFNLDFVLFLENNAGKSYFLHQ